MPGFAMPGTSPVRAVRLAAVILALLATVIAGLTPAAAQDDPTETVVATEQPTEAPTEPVATEAPTEAPTDVPTEDPATEQLKVAAILCLDWSCHEFGDRLDSFTIVAVDIDTGEDLGSCVTDLATEFEGCWLEIPAGSKWGLTFPPSQTPEGYVYHGSIIAVSGGAHGEITYLPFHPLEDPEPGQMVVQAALCTDASCREYEKFLDNFLISAVNPVTGQEYSECMTDNAQQNLDHQCILDVPAKGEVALRWVEDQVPEGYKPFGKPIVSDDGVSTIAFVPEGDDPAPTQVATQAPVTSLPVTGTQGPDGDVARPVALVMLATVLLGMLAVTVYRDVGNRR